MTAYELRQHLAVAHGLQLRGAAMESLRRIHDMDHENAPSHAHEEEGDS